MVQPVANLNINHLGISVPDLDAAVAWYTTHLGFVQLRPHNRVKRGPPEADVVDRGGLAIYGPELNEMRIAYLASGNIGIELFQFISPAYSGPGKPNPFGTQHWVRGGCFHIALTHPDPEALFAKLVEAGGEKIRETARLGRGIVALYIQDPWGIIWEICSRSFETFQMIEYVPE
ncbi:uncharacterized protein PV09_06400 [Verruconis gallopava]|uniref:VOC domain-containing protein n=1 Tax=Verruconis gallopava TaxID=253628 RepID=A0A0D2A672_9PEZI|nr:uncharacterized protein PV09_06400 [Verruconis gallopava]KIW02248.1 hypothetical protein PV09_06400 [Verruconis gallopava]